MLGWGRARMGKGMVTVRKTTPRDDIVSHTDETANRRLLEAIKSREPDWEAAFSAMTDGADPNTRDAFGWSIVDVAATADRADIIDRLVASGVDVSRPGDQGVTALMRATGAGCLQSMIALLRHGSDVNHQDRRRQSALTRTVLLGPVTAKAIILLLDSGADPSQIEPKAGSLLDVMDSGYNRRLLPRLDRILARPNHRRARQALLASATADQADRLLPRCRAVEAQTRIAAHWHRGNTTHSPVR